MFDEDSRRMWSKKYLFILIFYERVFSSGLSRERERDPERAVLFGRSFVNDGGDYGSLFFSLCSLS